MPLPIGLIFRHVWILFIVVTIINASIGKSRSRRYIRERPELAPGYQKLFRGFLIWENPPWILMGFSIETGRVRSI
jgi:hypothetical protein